MPSCKIEIFLKIPQNSVTDYKQLRNTLKKKKIHEAIKN